MIDQHGAEVPSLVLLHPLDVQDGMSDAEREAILRLDWYQPSMMHHMIFVPVPGLLDIFPHLDLSGCFAWEDLEPAVRGMQCCKIEQVLHRWSFEDGFYHA